MTFDYFYEEQSEQFAFYRIPKMLFTEEIFEGISTDAKVLYGLLLDRVSLSRGNGWIDEQGRVFIIFTILSIQDTLGCSDKSASKYMAELENFGLIERARQGQGKPSIIYVKQFNHPKNLRILKSKKYDSETEDSTCLEAKKLRGNNTNINNTDFNDSNPILSVDEEMDERESYRAYFMEQLGVEYLKIDHPHDHELIDGILELILDIVCTRKKIVRITGDDKPADVVKGRFMKLNSSHIDYVMMCLQKNTTKVHNMRQYMLAALYNAPLTMNSFYQAWVNNDMATGKI